MNQGTDTKKKILIKNGFILPMDGERPYIENGEIAVQGDRIMAVGSSGSIAPDFLPDETIDASHKAVLPGFINTHTHLIGALNKGLTEDFSGISGGLFKIAMPLHYVYTEASDVYWLALMHGLEMLKTGTTTINEIGRFENEVAKAVRDLGLRAVLAENIREADVMRVRPGETERHFDREEGRRSIETALALAQEWHGACEGRITCRLGPHAPDTCTEETLLRVKELAVQHGLGLHTHLAQVPGEREYMLKTYGKSPVQFLYDHGCLSPHLVAAHCVFMSPEDVELMCETGAHMSHTAYLVGKRGYFPPMTEIYKRQMSLSLGSDWLSNDMFKIMRAAILLARQQSQSVEIVDGFKVLEMATVGGARALGLENALGSLAPGKKADIIMLDLRAPWLNPIRPQQIVPNIVYNANGSDVTDVMVDGKMVVADGRCVTVDEDDALSACQKSAEIVWERARELFTE
jgi:5-methylthioadenosine/S-adenosylhomocysteine deaminase